MSHEKNNSIKNINIVHWNCRSVKEKENELPHLMNKYEIDILCLNETFLENSSRFKLPGYNLISKPRQE